MTIFACNNAGTETNAGHEKNTSETEAVDKEKIKEEIQAKEDEFAATYNSGVMKNIGYYADEAVAFHPNRAPLVGKPAILDFLASSVGSSSTKIMFKTNEVFVSNDGIQVVELGNYKVVDSSNTVINTGNYMTLFEKRNGKYVCLREMNASVMPFE